ncbi:hypothetical protein BDA99DRAFT_248496 [Phascolomyces articulosus]|uniref:FHA domain-containing protein n=1 Tax=Phascolomyces articulosus TaxID=60185 RepID=A0AAD5K921_9FUNG|nr:hypothetical protein BDA99DRAFT_248496 [Phascolomyces articulosus]
MSLSSNGTSNGSKKPAPELIGLLRGIDNCVGIPILKNERLTIGRYKKCDLRIDLSIITEVHAIVHTVTVNTSTDFQIVLPIITDVSQNGTYLNKRLIGRKHSAMLFSGCVVQLVHEDIQFYYISAKDLFPPVPGHLIVKNILICPERLQTGLFFFLGCNLTFFPLIRNAKLSRIKLGYMIWTGM